MYKYIAKKKEIKSLDDKKLRSQTYLAYKTVIS